MSAPSLPAQVIADIEAEVEARRAATILAALDQFMAECDAIVADRSRALAKDVKR